MFFCLFLAEHLFTDDPEGREYFQRTFEYADADPDIKILGNLNDVGGDRGRRVPVQPDVILQKSIREGFGLTVTEALWKGGRRSRQRRRHPCRSRTGSGAPANSPWSAPQRGLEILATPARQEPRPGRRGTRAAVALAAALRDWLSC